MTTLRLEWVLLVLACRDAICGAHMTGRCLVLVTDLMTTALITGAPDDLVDKSLYDMKLASIRHLPVVSDRRRLVGIVSDRDVLLSLGTSQDRNVYLRDIMTRTTLTIAPDDDATKALELMLQRKIGSLPVVGDEGELVGIVTETDFLEVAYSLLSDSPIDYGDRLRS